MEEQLKIRRYWVLKEPVAEGTERILVGSQIVTRPWMRHQVIEAGDVGYFYGSEKDPGIWGWCVLRETQRTEEKGGYLSIEVSNYTELNDGVSEGELRGDKRLRFFGQVVNEADGGPVTTEEALALNRLLRERGEEAPQDPDEYLPREISRDHRLCDTCQYALDSAYRLAYETSSRPVVTTSMLLFALLETDLGESFDPPQYFVAHRDLFPEEKTVKIKKMYLHEGGWRKDPELGDPSSIPETSEPVMTRDVDVLLSAAERLPKATGSVEVSPDHIFGAVVEPDPISETMGAPERLREMGLDFETIRRDFLKYVKGSSPDSAPIWEEALSEPLDETRYLAACNSDLAVGVDKLKIKSEVDALASLVASKKLDPPLSIGLFGDWGSGKSFFIKEMRERVCWLAGEAERSGNDGEVPFHKKIVQIEFNAWQYSESNLWASLVTHIFNNLRLSVSDPEKDPEEVQKKRKELVLEKLDQKEKLRDHAEETLERAEGELVKVKTSLGKEQGKFDSRLRDLSKMRASDAIDLVGLTPEIMGPLSQAAGVLGIKVSTGSAREVQGILAEGRRLTSGLSSPWLAVAASETWQRWFLWALALAGAFAFIRYLPDIFPELGVSYAGSAIWEFISKALGPAATALGWLHTQLKKANSAVESLSEANERFAARLGREEEALRADLLTAQDVLKDQRAIVEEARRSLKRAERGVKEKREELADLEPDRRFKLFIEERALSKDYRKELGILSRISEDFRRLSRFIVESDDPLSIDRIILYIDDLDRCPEDKVLKVLEAVHLLLAYELFVVVVAVDSRWIRRSLIRKYRGLIKDDRPHMSGTAEQVGSNAATSEDYLEKIFQVPFWVKPMDDGGCRDLVKDLLKNDLKQAQAGKGEGNVRGEAAEHSEADTGATGTVKSGGVRAFEKAVRDAEERRAAAIKEEQERWLVRPERMTLEQGELDFIEELAPIISRSPRSVKRFVNVYRIMRAGLSRAELTGFLGENNKPAKFRAALLLLGVLNGSPSLAADLFREIEGQPKGKAFSTFVKALKTKHKDSDRTEWKEFLEKLASLAKTRFKGMKMEPFQEWSSRVARYSFRMEMVREAGK